MELNRHKELQMLHDRLRALRESVDELEELLSRYERLQETLQESEDRFRLFIEEVRDYAMFLLDPTGLVMSWNLGAERIKGYHADEIIGQHFSVFYPPEDQANGKPARSLATARNEGQFTDEGWRMRRDGTRFWALVVLTALYDRDGTLRGFGKVTRDLSERREAEERRRALEIERLQREQAEATLQAHEDFLAQIAHELRTPVTALLGFAQLLQRRLGDHLDDPIQRPLDTIVEQAHRLNRLTALLLDLTRLESGKIELEHAPLDLCALVARVVQQWNMISESHPIEMILPSRPAIIDGDELRLYEMLTTLIQNAIKYSPDGGEITVQMEVRGPAALISIRDQGIGIPSGEIPQVFECFYRASNVNRTHIPGLGVGLFLARELVQRHGGGIRIESEVGRGTVVMVSLPLTSEER